MSSPVLRSEPRHFMTLAITCAFAASVFSCSGGDPEAARLAAQSAAAGGGIVIEADPDGESQADSGNGKIYGEFEDLGFFERALRKRPEKAGWSDRQVWDGLSGATIQAKTMGPSVPDRVVLLDGKEMAYADGFGQFWLSLPPGAYSLTGRCEGYRDAVIQVEVQPGKATFANFYLAKGKK